MMYCAYGPSNGTQQECLTGWLYLVISRHLWPPIRPHGKSSAGFILRPFLLHGDTHKDVAMPFIGVNPTSPSRHPRVRVEGLAPERRRHSGPAFFEKTRGSFLLCYRFYMRASHRKHGAGRCGGLHHRADRRVQS
ncbi:hypothetical protein D9M69_283500 [compost metagenome]